MKIRVISALVGLAILAIVLALYNTYVFNVVMSAISVIAVLELLSAIKATKHKDLMAVSLVFTVLLPFARETMLWKNIQVIMYLIFICFFVLLLKNNGRIKVEQASMAFMMSGFITLGFSCAIYMRNQFGDMNGRYYLLLALAAAWLCDTGAYFSGRFFGKHKLAPVISPKKTVEGSIGGVILTMILVLPITMLYAYIATQMGHEVTVNYAKLMLAVPVLAVLGMLGDLSMSVIKRQCGVKDYGNIMPGHGGILDRFDSVLFTLPSVYIFVQHFQLINIV